MGSVEDDEPPSKRVKASSVGFECVSNITSSVGFECVSNISSILDPIAPLGGSMAKPLPSQGQDDTIGSKGIIKRVEFIRIITKALNSLGYERSGAVLEEESGVSLHSSTVNIFRKQVLDGNWNDSVVTLNQIGSLNENVLKSASFLILEHKYFELLEKDRYMDALDTLKHEMVPLGNNTKRLHELASCIVSPSRCHLSGFAKLGMGTSNARLELLEELQAILPSSIMIPENRLLELVEQALNVQRETCAFHNCLDGCLSLYADHCCGKEQLHFLTTQVLFEHQGEVWFLKFSNEGEYLASSSNDMSAIIWEVRGGDLTFKHKLIGHQKPVLMVAWSPDDSQLLTCGEEEAVRRWDVKSGECLHVYEKTGFGVISCGWSPDGTQIFSSVTDKTICFWDLDGKELDSWKGLRPSKNFDVGITKDGKLIISKETVILLLNRERKVEKLIEEQQTIISFSVSRDDKHLLVNLLNQEIHLWSIQDEPKLITKYKGHKRTRMVIGSCFGGSDQSFIVSGSEDSKVYIWHRGTGNLIGSLPGHSGTVNSVSWNPSNPHMFASASDDRTIRIWGTSKALVLHKETYSNGVKHHCNGNFK